MPKTIPAAFAAQWGEWCGAQGIRGKFSLIPFPAGVGRIDKGFPGFPERGLADWLRVAKEIIWPNFDLTPEMLTHTRVVDLKTWQLTEEWEQGAWVNPDLFITEDLQGGRLPAVLKAELPCVLVGHWPCFYVNDQIGFKVLKTVKRRLDAYDPDRTKTLWMKNSEIGHYWMARQLSDIAVQGQRVQIRTQFPTPNFTLSLGVAAQRVEVKGADLKRVQSQRDFRSGTCWVDGRQTLPRLIWESAKRFCR